MFYKFKVTYWDDYDEKDKADCGLVFAEDYSMAASRVKEDFGSSLVDMYLQELDTANTISIDEIKETFPWD